MRNIGFLLAIYIDRPAGIILGILIVVSILELF